MNGRWIASERGSSPHTRGAPFWNKPPRFKTRIIPAYAGSTRVRAGADVPHGDHPRIRGEHSRITATAAGRRGSSPHTRGAHQNCFHVSTHPGDHPRIRGEHTVAIDPKDDWEGSSPHTRGARLNSFGLRDWCGIIPAYAGSTIPFLALLMLSWDHPRIRGEHLMLGAIAEAVGGSSPHTRGALGSRQGR